MIRLLPGRKCSPIGLDIGSRCVKVVQFDGQNRLHEAARIDLPNGDLAAADREAHLVRLLRQLRAERNFRGHEVAVALPACDLHIQNVRVPKQPGVDLARQVLAEAQPRFPFPADSAEARFIEAADVRQGDATLREVIVVACDRRRLDQRLELLEAAGLQPMAVDIEAQALLRCYSHQFRRDEDRQQRLMLVHVGASKTMVLVSRGFDPLFVKYVDIGGGHFDAAVAAHLQMAEHDAADLRRHNSDRRSDAIDNDIQRSIAAAMRPVVERLANEIALCTRYHNVAFRGQPVARMVLTGGEAGHAMLDILAARLNIPCEIGDPWRACEGKDFPTRKSQWDIAVGLALWPRP